MDFVGSEQLFYPEGREPGPVSSGHWWSLGRLASKPYRSSHLDGRISWTREREESGTWKRLPQDVPLRLVTKLQWSPLTSLSLDITGDLLSERVLDRQNLVRSEPRFLLHAGAIVETGAGFVLSLSARNLLNRMMAKGRTTTGESLDIAEMGLLGFPINGREIMLILALKGLEEL